MRKIILLNAVFILFIVIINSAGASDHLSVKYSYWDNGKRREADYYNAQGILAGTKYYRDSGSLEQFIKYDAGGHTIEESYYDTDGKLCKNPVDNWAVKKTKYTDGLVTGVSYYDAAGKLTERDYYDKNGNFTDRQFFGNERVGTVENYKPDLSQFDSAAEEIDSRLPLGEEADQFYTSSGDPEYGTATIVE